jgi:uncharacterized membrane protein YobD (UPF0266 family)
MQSAVGMSNVKHPLKVKKKKKKKKAGAMWAGVVGLIFSSTYLV